MTESSILARGAWFFLASFGFFVVAAPVVARSPGLKPAGLSSDRGVTDDTGVKDSRQRPQSTEERQVAAAIEALFAAAERNDIAALDSLYAGNDLTVIESTGINRGWADYRDHHLAPEMKEMKGFRYRPFEIEPHVAGTTAWAIFRYNLKAETGGRVLDLIGRGTAILEKKGGRWVVRHTHTASRARRPTDPPANF
ncbi:MAG: nuclear transport factor 2 family protein [Gemmatimonadaceae bacterium]|nr:nuclear transport factor 2 family protein [Gemmatimonadaceae bacterium]